MAHLDQHSKDPPSNPGSRACLREERAVLAGCGHGSGGKMFSDMASESTSALERCDVPSIFCGPMMYIASKKPSTCSQLHSFTVLVLLCWNHSKAANCRPTAARSAAKQRNLGVISHGLTAFQPKVKALHLGNVATAKTMVPLFVRSSVGVVPISTPQSSQLLMG